MHDGHHSRRIAERHELLSDVIGRVMEKDSGNNNINFFLRSKSKRMERNLLLSREPLQRTVVLDGCDQVFQRIALAQGVIEGVG